MKTRIRDWWVKYKTPIVVVLVIGVVLTLYLLAESLYAYSWSGFGPYTPPKPPIEGYQREKTTWDWLQLLIIPIVLAIGGFFFSRRERINADKAADRRAETEREIEEQRAQDAALQAYLDQMTQLLLHENLRISQPDDEVRSVARARTLTVLRVLDGIRKATVLQFLYEAKLIGGITYESDGDIIADAEEDFAAVINLSEADLSGACLSKVRLSATNLHNANLSDAILEEAWLDKANLQGAKLKGSKLKRAYLSRTLLNRADLSGADLSNADLSAAELLDANLSETILANANLRDANLNGADLTDCPITPEQLKEALEIEEDYTIRL